MKIFGIGLPKTGTKSLNLALEQLGFVAHHNPRNMYAQLLVGNYNLPEDKPWDALTHFGVTQYRALNAAYPDCKFVLTVRDKAQWLESTRGQMLFFDPDNKHMERMRIDVFGCVVFDPMQFSIVYDAHLREVTKFFSEIDADRWLMLEVCGPMSDDEKWKELTDFLGVDNVPRGTMFPHGNNNAEVRGRLEELAKETGKAYLARRLENGDIEIIGER